MPDTKLEFGDTLTVNYTNAGTMIQGSRTIQNQADDGVGLSSVLPVVVEARNVRQDIIANTPVEVSL